MTIVIPENYHAEKLLKDHGIVCKTPEEARKEKFPSIRIGILNIMPQAETYEFNLLYPLGRSILQVEPVWIRLKTHNYYSTENPHLENLYVFFEEAVAEKKLDGLILTGAPVEDIPFHEVIFWDEVCEIIDYAKMNITSTLGICWGGLAFAKFMGVEKEVYRKKIFGVLETKNLTPIIRLQEGWMICSGALFPAFPAYRINRWKRSAMRER